MDEEGHFVSTEDVVEEVDAQIASEYTDFANAVLNFQQSMDLLAKARIARCFYPLVVPAGYTPPGPSRTSQAKGSKSKSKGKGSKGSKGSKSKSGKGQKRASPEGKGGAKPTRPRGKAKSAPHVQPPCVTVVDREAISVGIAQTPWISTRSKEAKAR